MNANDRPPFKIWFTTLILFIALLESCSYNPSPNLDICTLLNKLEPRELKDSLKTLVFEDPGTIIVFHGFGCAESNNDGSQNIINVLGTQDIPMYATDAMVFLNGWHLKYLHSDHNVYALGTAIRDIQFSVKPDRSGKILNWQAAGVISDKNFDDPYNWCYFYTVIAWNSSNLNLIVDQRTITCDPRDHRDANFYFAENNGTYTALSSFASFLRNPDITFGKTAVIIPRGFGFVWKGSGDNNLLQIGYNLDHSEKFIEKDKNYYKKSGTETPALVDSASFVDSGFVSWETYTIYKDNNRRRDYMFGEIVSALGGNDLNVINPTYSILPKQNEHIDIVNGGGILTENVTVKHVPFRYAIPVLTGWNLEYQGDDENVKELGVWIDEMHYDKDPNVQTGTLRYTLKSIMVDKDQYPAHNVTHKATILGIGTVTGLSSQKSPDLIPYSPAGNSPSAFCRLEENGNERFLRVTIKNQGNADARASKTKVIYSNNKSITLDTPPIHAGSEVDLLFKVPSDCFSPDCSFKITVDSEYQIEEFNKQNNSVNGGCIG
jgi:CARDB